ncbi:hypothetical protein IH992_18480 [Candidatus Poribacteria bacterium]|nr:hypothetical protein [Candidatus Poribacteria bacterium]
MMVNRTDKVVIAASGTILLTFLIATKYGSIWVLYLNVLITSGLFGYGIRQESEFSSHLSRSVISAVSASITYIPLDWLFSKKAHLIFYLRPDIPWMPSAPLSLVFTWMIVLTVPIYLYQRLNAIWGKAYISAGVTATAVLISSTILGMLGSARFLWNANLVSGLPHIGSLPTFVPIALFLTFLLSPYYFSKRQHPIVSGMRCGIFVGAMLFLCFVFFFLFWRKMAI